jgi:DNA polymerase-4
MSLNAPDAIGWLFLDLNSYFASVEQQLRPELRGQPVAVVPLQSDSTCAIAASYEAKAYGVKTGTRIFDAKRLCPQLVCITADHARYTEFHHRVLEEVDRHIPVTSIESIDEDRHACASRGDDPLLYRYCPEPVSGQGGH